ncbi:DUF502 domain-containing protein [Brevibacillus sp. HD1.4A]|uniref:DUF502 domain-containing protein n=1 Tax=Brevibacillus sp. HD1.4A TaxID=2738978 RepID=UPI00156AD0DE|nr:DUF502 domain-containing protein [Brevibacillus sp. HD1.4A]NRQ51930.1 DUF502 domain-containing protein [Brevibacillus sp. HD1.4A]
MKRVIRYFLEGLLYVIPLAVTIYILYYIFATVDSWFYNLARSNFPLHFPGIGVLITIVGITVVGFLASNVLTRGVLSIVDRLFEKVPFIKLIYTSIKDLIGAFVGDKKSFDKPVLVTLSKDTGAKVIGFITKESMDTYGLADHVAVYLPQSYNFAGNLLLFPSEQVQPLDMDSADVMAFLVSGGVSGKKTAAKAENEAAGQG